MDPFKVPGFKTPMQVSFMFSDKNSWGDYKDHLLFPICSWAIPLINYQHHIIMHSCTIIFLFEIRDRRLLSCFSLNIFIKAFVISAIRIINVLMVLRRSEKWKRVIRIFFLLGSLKLISYSCRRNSAHCSGSLSLVSSKILTLKMGSLASI